MLRYYPISRIQKNKSAQAGQFQLNGKDYVGPYYETFDGDCYTGKDPITGKNELLKPISSLQIYPISSHFDKKSCCCLKWIAGRPKSREYSCRFG